MSISAFPLFYFQFFHFFNIIIIIFFWYHCDKIYPFPLIILLLFISFHTLLAVNAINGSKSRPPGSTTSPAGGLDNPLRGSLWFRLKAGPGKPVPFVTGSRLKAAYSFLTLRALLPVDPSHIAHLYTF